MERRNHQFRVDSGYMEELRFRSHLFGTSVEGFNSLSRNHRDHPYVSDVVVDTLSDQFSSLSLLPPPKQAKLRHVPTLPSTLQCLRSNGPKADQRLYGDRSMLESFYELHLSRIRKNELQQDRAKVLQKQEARLHSIGLVHRNSNVLKESVGTGVFHPLHRPTTTTQTFNSLKKPTKAEQRKRTQSDKNELLTKARRGVMTTESTRQEEQQKKDECHYHLPPGMDFSKNWTF